MFEMATLASAFAISFVGAAIAGEQDVDNTGFAVSGYDVVSCLNLAQTKVGRPKQSALQGSTAIAADCNGASFAFATEANRATFLANQASCVPQYDGHCA